MPLPHSVTTLEDFRVSGRTITAFCSHYWVCSHDAQLRLDVVAEHVGWSFDFFEGRAYLARKLYCSVCGWYEPTFSLGHASKPKGHGGSHSAGFEPLSSETISKIQKVRQAAAQQELPWVGTRKGGRKFGR